MTSDKMIQTAIKKGFVDLDEAIMEVALTASPMGEPLQDRVKQIGVCLGRLVRFASYV